MTKDTTPTTPEAGELLAVTQAGGTFACPICGEEKPHHHTAPVANAYQNKRSRK